jgi:hypothetical protein
MFDLGWGCKKDVSFAIFRQEVRTTSIVKKKKKKKKKVDSMQ